MRSLQIETELYDDKIFKECAEIDDSQKTYADGRAAEKRHQCRATFR